MMELLALLKNKLGASYRQTTPCKVTKKEPCNVLLTRQSFGGLWFLGFRIRRLPSNDLTGRDVEKTQALVALICRIVQKQGERDCAIKREVERTEATAQFYCNHKISTRQSNSKGRG
jgi:hypothetical protein